VEIKAISVSTFNKYIASIIDAEEFLSQIGVYGEIVDLKISKNIAFFGLKDKDAILNCVCFFDFVYNKLENGKEFTLVGAPQFYVKGGRLTFKVTKAIETGRSGINYLKFLELKEKLSKKGYFDESRKKPLKFYNKNIGVVTSEKGAVIRDIISVCRRRDCNVNISLFNVSVQGKDAPSEIARGIEIMDNLGFDVIIVARGGGSDEDLSPFNDELVADAIYNAKSVIVSAVGHETDTTICDYCADLRAPTPSAAAELVTKDISKELANFEKVVNLVYKFATGQIVNYKNVLNYDIRDLSNNYGLVLENKKHKFFGKVNLFKINLEKSLIVREMSLDKFSTNFENLNPLKILELGYAKVTKNGACVDANSTEVGDNLLVEFKDGSVKVKVEEK